MKESALTIKASFLGRLSALTRPIKKKPTNSTSQLIQKYSRMRMVKILVIPHDLYLG